MFFVVWGRGEGGEVVFGFWCFVCCLGFFCCWFCFFKQTTHYYELLHQTGLQGLSPNTQETSPPTILRDAHAQIHWEGKVNNYGYSETTFINNVHHISLYLLTAIILYEAPSSYQELKHCYTPPLQVIAKNTG